MLLHLFLSIHHILYIYQVCREWEANALQVDEDVRLALIRIGIVLGKDGGALGIILLLKDYLHFRFCGFDF